MAPVIPHRSLVIVDRPDRMIRSRRRRDVRRDGRTLNLLLESRAHLPAQREPDEGDSPPIVGRVVYWWRSRGDDEDEPEQIAEKKVRYRAGRKP